MTDFSHISGQERAIRLLQGALANGHISHAYLFEGPAGTGKRQTALAFAKAILCERGGIDSCGDCLSCRKFESGNHMAITRITPDGASVKIDQIRDLQKQFAFRNTSGAERQLYMIEQADTMTTQAANSLLKFLEEPGLSITAVLIADNGQAILPTIRSRTQHVPFVPLTPDAMAPFLIGEGCPEPVVRAAVHLSAGLAGARELAGHNWFAEIRNVMIQLAKESSTQAQAALLSAQQLLFKGELADHADTLLDLFVLWFKDMVRIQWNKREHIVFIDQIDYLAQAAHRRTTSEWTRLMQNAIAARRRLGARANAQLTVDQFLLSCEGG